MIPDRIFYPLAGLLALALIGLAMAFPQGQGARSIGPFGHPPVQQTAEAQAAIRREAELDAKAKQTQHAMEAAAAADAAAAASDTPPPAIPKK
jgi:hypothetical protein